MKKLIIIRGPSGSGKSTLAAKLQSNHLLRFEADQFFCRDGKYEFDATKLGAAHGECQRRVRDAMEDGEENIVVSNTSMTVREVCVYTDLADEYGYEVKIYRTKGPWDANLFAARNVHNVSLEVVQRQINKYQPIEGEEEHE